MAEAAFNPTPGVRLGIDQDSYEANGNKWIRFIFYRVTFCECSALALDNAIVARALESNSDGFAPASLVGTRPP